LAVVDDEHQVLENGLHRGSHRHVATPGADVDAPFGVDFVGMLLVPPVLLKIGSTGWRFARYYAGTPAYRRKGPPPPLLRILGAVVVLLTIAVLVTGIGLIAGPHSLRHSLRFAHKASFILWFGAMTIHVLGHLIDTARLAPLDWARRTRHDVAGAFARQWALAASLVIGAVLGI
jgi:hypothetical protein